VFVFAQSTFAQLLADTSGSAAVARRQRLTLQSTSNNERGMRCGWSEAPVGVHRRSSGGTIVEAGAFVAYALWAFTSSVFYPQVWVTNCLSMVHSGCVRSAFIGRKKGCHRRMR